MNVNENELVETWNTLDPGVDNRRRIDTYVGHALEALDTPLAAEWFALFRAAPIRTVGFSLVSAVSIVAGPLALLARTLLG